jgi:dihydrofolate reductase
MKVSVIFAQTKGGAIGALGPHPLPWHYPIDLKRFKVLTQDKPIIMGSNTFDSLPNLLPGRYHLVVTGSKGLARLGPMDRVQFVNSLEEAITWAGNHGDEVFIIGGAGLIDEGIKIADTVYRTVVLDEHEIKGRPALVEQPGLRPPYWGRYEQTSSALIDESLLFETYQAIEAE